MWGCNLTVYQVKLLFMQILDQFHKGCFGRIALFAEHGFTEKAFSDGAQTLYVNQYEQLVDELKIIASAVNRTL